MKVTWLGHSSVRIDTGGQVIYIDPYEGDAYVKASLILVSRFDFDHCSMKKLEEARADTTLIIGTKELISKVYPAKLLRVGERVQHGNVEVVGMPVLQRHNDTEKHEAEDALGFLIIAEDKRVYFMGDSDFEPEMRKARPDVLLIAVGGTYSAGPKEAAQIAEDVGARLVIPIHWGRHAGTRDDADLFSELCKVPAKVLAQGESVTI